MDRRLNQWSTGLFDCCDGTVSCCYGFWCCPCLACKTSKRAGEHLCICLNDCVVYALILSLKAPLVPPAALSLRILIRKKYGIEASLCNDITASCCCVWCSWCQMYRELKIREENDTAVINMQPQPENYCSAPPLPEGEGGGDGGVNEKMQLF